MKKLSLIVFAGIMIYASSCGNQSGTTTSGTDTVAQENTTENDVSTYDPKRGEGKFTTVEVGDHLDVAMAGEGKKVYDVKCSSCHKITDERLVGPGWKGVTTRHELVWLMNFITNPDPMITKDPALQAQLELCLVRMPNQNLNDVEARNVVEFMRENDGVK